MTNFLKSFIADESGASAAEYALILAVVGVAIGGASLYLADTVKTAVVGAGDRVTACAQAAASATGTSTACPKATSGTTTTP